MNRLAIALHLLPLAAVLPGGVSCVHLRPADREFEAAAHFAPESDGARVEGAAAEDGSGKRALEDPDFEQMKFDRELDPAMLQPPSGPYRVGPGDVLDIEVAERADTRRTTRVMPDGMLYYDVAEGVDVAGMTLREISTKLSHLLEDDYVDPVVTVNVAEADSRRFWMLGQVNDPGAYPIRKPTTLIDALSRGGGLLSQRDGVEVSNPESADLERAILIRDGKLIPADFQALVTAGDMSQNVYVRAGDYIFIPSLTARSIYVLGDVSRPGPVFYERGTSLLSAVAAAGGPRPDTVATKALVIRGSTRRPEVAVVNLRRIVRGREPDLRLDTGDIVWVPRSPWTKLEDYLDTVLVTAAQAVAVQEGLGVLGTAGDAGVSISAGGN